MNHIRYDRLYSTNEFVVLFCGTGESVASLDGRIEKLNQELRSRYYLRQRLGVVDLTTTLSLPSQPEISEGKTIKAYKLDLNSLPKNSQIGLQSRFKKLLEGYRKEKSIDFENNFPLFAKAEKEVVAEEYIPQRREEVKRRYEGNPLLRGEEISLYIQGLLYLAAEEKPQNVLVFPREHKKSRK